MKNLLPIGSVVRLIGGRKSLMIIGTMQQDDEKKIYDYISCVFPEGYIDAETFFLFNNEDVEEVVFIGCINAESQTYTELLKQAEAKQNGLL